MPKSNRSGKSTIITQQQLKKVCNSLPEKYSLLAECLYFTSNRVKEMATIKVRNINFREGLLTIEKNSTKTKQTKTIPLHPNTLTKLKSWVANHSLTQDDYVFFTNSRNTKFKVGEKPISTSCIDEYFRKAFDWNGISGASTHSFRKSRLNHLHTQGWNLSEIQHISGHSTLKALEYYLEADKNNTFNKYKNLFDNSSEKFIS